MQSVYPIEVCRGNFGERPNCLQLINQRLNNLKHTNIQIHIGEMSFNCHTLLLQCFSEVFDELGNVPEVTLPKEKVTPRAFQIVYNWLLSPKPDVPREHFIEVFQAAEFLRITALLDQCWTCIGDTEALLEDRAFQLYTEALPFNQTVIQNMMLKRICIFFLPLVASEAFVELPLEDLSYLLKSNSIGVFSEADVLYAAAVWLLYDWEARNEHVGDVIKLVRFLLFSPALLSALIGCDTDERIIGILQHAVTQNLATQALANLCKSNSDQVSKPDNRVWLKDPEVPAPEHERSGYIPYHQECQFNEFLKRLEDLGHNRNSWCCWQKIEIVLDMGALSLNYDTDSE
ncbi:kelch-like protein 18 [Topomyia yanbarensis]|uniref:kelch-like protein 18 n=1 Tax=Topomyia yanbarensis TaxID=2498891 RepID=UPI00273C696C|nr:kelch-like protein 18 [Topomyia yanbarensis]